VNEVGTETITLDGTESGTFVHATNTIDGDETDTTSYELGNDETNDNGTATGDDHVDGKATQKVPSGVNVLTAVTYAAVGGALHLSTAEAEITA
jgi:hypothetical protein